jgi:hypothetical protein
MRTLKVLLSVWQLYLAYSWLSELSWLPTLNAQIVLGCVETTMTAEVFTLAACALVTVKSMVDVS